MRVGVAWAIATTLAFALGMGLAIAIGLVVGLATRGPFGGAVGAAVVGFAVSAAQYAVVRGRGAAPRFAPWTGGAALASALGWLVGQCAALPLRGVWTPARGFLVFLVIGAVIGAAVGAAQRLAWRACGPAFGTWVAASALGWGLGLAAFASSSLGHTLRLVGVLLPGAITAGALVLGIALGPRRTPA